MPSHRKSTPIAFANHAFSPCEINYGITELETLVVVWSFLHFRSYLYGKEVIPQQLVQFCRNLELVENMQDGD